MVKTTDPTDDTSVATLSLAACPEGAIAPPAVALTRPDEAAPDRVAVVYNRGAARPQITVRRQSRQVQTVLADGIPVAVVARAKGAPIRPEDVLLVERG